jgi:hypothetical protein
MAQLALIRSPAACQRDSCVVSVGAFGSAMQPVADLVGQRCRQPHAACCENIGWIVKCLFLEWGRTYR